MSDDRTPPGALPSHLREVRDALRLILDEQMHTIDQLLQRSAILLGAASVLTGLLAASPDHDSTPVWRECTSGIAFAALLASLFAGIIAVWPRQKQQSLPGGAAVAGVQTYVSMAPAEFLRLQCDEAYTTITTGGYASLIAFRRRVFRAQTVALVIGGILIGFNGLSLVVSTSQPHHPASSRQHAVGLGSPGAMVDKVTG